MTALSTPSGQLMKAGVGRVGIGPLMTRYVRNFPNPLSFLIELELGLGLEINKTDKNLGNSSPAKPLASLNVLCVQNLKMRWRTMRLKRMVVLVVLPILIPILNPAVTPLIFFLPFPPLTLTLLIILIHIRITQVICILRKHFGPPSLSRFDR